MFCIPNIKTIMMKLMQSQLVNIMIIKVIKKHNNFPVQINLNYSRA